MEIKQRENIQNCTVEYLVSVGFLRKKLTLTSEQIMAERYPLWFKLLRYSHKILCKHEWSKVGKANMEGYFLGDKPNTYVQGIRCGKCDKEKTI